MKFKGTHHFLAAELICIACVALRIFASPELMHQGANLCVVNISDTGHHFWRERRQTGGQRVVGYLAGTLPPRNGAGDRIEHEDPTESKLAHAYAGGTRARISSTAANASSYRPRKRFHPYRNR
jgi:hypothetical protein